MTARLFEVPESPARYGARDSAAPRELLPALNAGMPLLVLPESFEFRRRHNQAFADSYRFTLLVRPCQLHFYPLTFWELLDNLGCRRNGVADIGRGLEPRLDFEGHGAQTRQLHPPDRGNKAEG